MENETPKRGRGRPKGSKNRPKENKTTNVFAMMAVSNLDWDSDGSKKYSLLGTVEGYGDWDFGIYFPIFFGKKIPNAKGSFSYWENFQIPEERINHCFVTLEGEKPKRLLVIGQTLIGPNEWGPEKTVMFSFGEWPPEWEWMNP